MFSSIELAHVYNLNKVGLKNFERLVEEHGILRLKDAIEYFGILSNFFMMLDDSGSGITSCSKSNDAKIQTKDGTSTAGFLFLCGQ